MRKFDLEAAKNGAKLCTRKGKPARIICYNAKGEYPIVALVDDGEGEYPQNVNEKGKFFESIEDEDDLFMAD